MHRDFGLRHKLADSVFQDFLHCPWMTPVLGDRGALDGQCHRRHCIPFASDPHPRARNRTYCHGDLVRLLSVGKFTLRKNHLLLLRACRHLVPQHRLHLTLVGEVSTDEHRSHLEDVKTTAESFGAKEWLDIRTNVAHAQMSDVYLEHDVFVLPSRDEPASISVLEAMSHGLPVICSTTSGTRYYVNHGDSGEIFASDDLNSLIFSIEQTIVSRSEIVRRGQNSLDLVEHQYSLDVFVQRFRIFLKRSFGIDL
jgi:glycosyltransferase involved in cell wall biosynthesis